MRWFREAGVQVLRWVLNSNHLRTGGKSVQLPCGTEGLDLLFAHRPLARRLLSQASERDTPMGRLRVVSVEGLIGFKLQGYVNDATRLRDLDDIRTLMQVHRVSLDLHELREYFALFNKQELLDELIA